MKKKKRKRKFDRNDFSLSLFSRESKKKINFSFYISIFSNFASVLCPDAFFYHPQQSVDNFSK
jgi:hypothetical protein